MYVFCPHSPQEDKQERGTAPPMGATEPAEAVGLSMGLPVAQGSTAHPASIAQQLVTPLIPSSYRALKAHLPQTLESNLPGPVLSLSSVLQHLQVLHPAPPKHHQSLAAMRFKVCELKDSF